MDPISNASREAATELRIVDRGRGPQLSTSRITVQDLFPYFQRNCADEEIMEIMPVLTAEEIRVVREYVRDNYQAVADQDRRIRERNAGHVDAPEVEQIRRKGREKVTALTIRQV